MNDAPTDAAVVGGVEGSGADIRAGSSAAECKVQEDAESAGPASVQATAGAPSGEAAPAPGAVALPDSAGSKSTAETPRSGALDAEVAGSGADAVSRAVGLSPSEGAARNSDPDDAPRSERSSRSALAGRAGIAEGDTAVTEGLQSSASGHEASTPRSHSTGAPSSARGCSAASALYAEAPFSPFGLVDDEEGGGCHEQDAAGPAATGGLSVQAPPSHASLGQPSATSITAGRRRTFQIDTDSTPWSPAAIVGVGTPEKHGAGFRDAYVSYEIVSRWPATERSPEAVTRVRRRYQDFVWLVDRLAAERAVGVVVPPLPERNRLGFMDRFSPEFVRRRQEALQRFLQRMLAHPRLSRHTALHAFLTADILALTSERRRDDALPNAPASADDLSQASYFDPENMPVPEDAGEEAFLVMRRAIGTIESHYTRVAALHVRAHGAMRTMAAAHANAKAGAQQLSSAFGRLEALVPCTVGCHFGTASGTGALEESLLRGPVPRPAHSGSACTEGHIAAADGDSDLVSSAARAVGASGVALKTLFERVSRLSAGLGDAQRVFAERLDYGVAAPASEFAGCCRAARHALRVSDACRQTYRAAVEGLGALEREYAAITGGGAVSDDSTDSLRPASRAGPPERSVPRSPKWGASIAAFFSDKIDAMRGRDTEAMRRERAERLRDKIVAGRVERDRMRRRARETDANVQAEFGVFLRVLDAEFRDVFVHSFDAFLAEYRRAERDVHVRAFPDLADADA